MEGTSLNANTRNTIKLILGTLGFLVLLIAAQAILAEHNHRVDLTPKKSLPSQSARSGSWPISKHNVQLMAFINSDRPENFFVQDLLERMASLSPRFHYTVVDINRNPALAREYEAIQYGTLVFESNGQRKGTLLSGGENGMVSALLQVTRSGEKVIYFLIGHGEGDLSNAVPQEGYTKIPGALADESYKVQSLSLTRSGSVPEDAMVVVLLGPKADLLPTELSALDAYVQRGGSLFVLLDTKAPPSLVTFLENHNVHLPPLVAVDPSNRMYAGEMLTFRASPTARVHPMLNSVNAPPIFSRARVVEVHGDSAKGIIASPILATSGEGFGTAEKNLTKEGTATLAPERGDMPGPVPVAGEVAFRSKEGRLGRIVVFGDVDLANNAFFEQGGNKDLFVNAVNWLAEDVEQMAARPRDAKSRHQSTLSQCRARPPGVAAYYNCASQYVSAGWYQPLCVAEAARMTWRRIVLYYVLGIALGSYFLLVEWNSRGEKPIITPNRVVKQSKFLPLARGEIAELELRRDKVTVLCRKDGQKWIVVEPAGAKVTSDLIASFIENLTPEKEVLIMEETAKNLSSYGLERPRVTVTVKGKNDSATVLIGDTNPTGSAVYVRKENSQQVVLLGSGVSYYEELIFETAGIKKQ